MAIPLHYLFSLAFLFLSLSLSPVSSLSTVSISETTSNQALICALTPSFSSPQQSQLNCTSFPSGIQIPLSNLSFSGIVGGDGFLCPLRSPNSTNSVMGCWRFSENGTNMFYKRLYTGPIIDELQAGNSQICGLTSATNRLECWQWPEFNPNITRTFSSISVGENFVCGLSELGNINCIGNITHQSNGMNNYTAIAAGFHHFCAISVNGSLDCWGRMVGEKPIGEFTSLALGENRSCALRQSGTVVCWGETNFAVPVDLRTTYFVAIQSKRNVFCGIALSDYALYCWGNDELDSSPMVFGSVVPGPCRADCPCSRPLPNFGSFCTQGLMVCEPCGGRRPSSGGPPVLPPPPPPLSSSPTPIVRRGDNWSGKNVALLVVGCVGSFCLLVVSFVLFFRYCKVRGCRVHDSGRLDEAEEGGGMPQSQPALAPVLEKRLSQLVSMGNGSRLEEFTLEVLIRVTDNFSESHKIGHGGFGSVYRATLEDGREVAIKRAEMSGSSSYQGITRKQEDNDNAFVNELESLSRLNHKNLVRLLGFCEDDIERVLVYEYMSNGTLHDHLHHLRGSLLTSWTARIQVALDAARGIEYLHVYTVPPIIHRDIKSSNILLDSTWTARVSDFGLSLMGPPDDVSHLSLRAAGTVGYMDPEYYRLQKLTTKSDVYSFGIVLLELLSGYKAIHRNENGVPRNVVDFVVPYIVQDEIHLVLDRNVPPPMPYEIEAVAHIGYIAADCVTLEGRHRPTMTEIVNSLERALDVCLSQAPLSRSTTGSTIGSGR